MIAAVSIKHPNVGLVSEKYLRIAVWPIFKKSLVK
jgi:hypothetical protein